MAEANAFTIEETGSNPVKVSLGGEFDRDMPFGMPREHEAFKMGGKNERNAIYLDGRSGMIIHTRQVRWPQLVLNGHLRDDFYGIDGHAQDTMNQLNKMLDNKRVCTGKYGPWTWKLFPYEFEFPVEGLNDIVYRLTFDVLAAPGFTQQPRAKKVETVPVDVVATATADLEADQAALMAQFILLEVQLQLNSGFQSVSNALSSCQDAAQAFQDAPAQGAAAQARLLRSKAQEAKSAISSLASTLGGLDPIASLGSTTADSIAGFQRAQLATMTDLAATAESMRSLQFTANQRIKAGTKLYQVAPGDTVESIATAVYQSAARAADIPYRQSDLVPGKLISLPV